MVPNQRAPMAGRTDRLRLPNELSTARSKLVYLTLALEGEQTVDQLSGRLQLGVSELYPVLRVLRNQGLVRREGEWIELVEVRDAGL